MAATEDSYFKTLGSGSPKQQPRQQFCGMFCPVEGSGDNKTLDFDALSSTSRSSPQPGGSVIEKQRDISRPKVEIRYSAGKEALQNVHDKVSNGLIRLPIVTFRNCFIPMLSCSVFFPS